LGTDSLYHLPDIANTFSQIAEKTSQIRRAIFCVSTFRTDTRKRCSESKNVVFLQKKLGIFCTGSGAQQKEKRIIL